MKKENSQEIFATAQSLAVNNRKDMDMDDRLMSFGTGSVNNLIAEEAANNTVSMTLANDTPLAKTIAIFPVAKSYFSGAPAGALTALQANHNLIDGDVFVDGGGKKITAQCLDSDMTLNRVIEYFGTSPSRVVSIQLETSNIDGTPNTSNFSGVVRSVWLNPFGKAVETKIQMRKYLNGATASPQFMEIPLLNDGHNVMLSSEHGLVLAIAPNTKLHVTLTIGAQLSIAQLAYRKLKAADRVLAPMRGKSC